MSTSKQNCSVFKCPSVRKNNPNLSFHQFPKDGEQLRLKDEFGNVEVVDRRKLWCVKLRMRKEVAKYMRVCSQHFTEEDFECSGWSQRKRLNSTAVPSHHLPCSSPGRKKVVLSRTRRDVSNLTSLLQPMNRGIALKRIKISKQKAIKAEISDEQKILFDCSTDIDKYECQTCSFRNNFLANLKDHIRNGHQSENVKEETVYKCVRCSLETHSQYLMGRHSLFGECATTDEAEKAKRFVCGKNGQLGFSLKPKIEAPILFQQVHDYTGLKEKSNRKSPVKSCPSTSEDINVIVLQCQQCLYKCKGIDKLERHTLSLHATPSSNKKSCPSRSRDDTNRLQCPHCPYEIGRGNPRKYRLKQHILFHHTNPEDIQWFECQKCPKKFKQKSSLKSHIRSKHTIPANIKLFDCELCTLKLKSEKNLKRHIVNCHTNSKHPKPIQWLVCDQCPFKCKAKQTLKQHKFIFAHEACRIPVV